MSAAAGACSQACREMRQQTQFCWYDRSGKAPGFAAAKLPNINHIRISRGSKIAADTA